jgi:hypothetical protein
MKAVASAGPKKALMTLSKPSAFNLNPLASMSTAAAAKPNANPEIIYTGVSSPFVSRIYYIHIYIPYIIHIILAL